MKNKTLRLTTISLLFVLGALFFACEHPTNITETPEPDPDNSLAGSWKWGNVTLEFKTDSKALLEDTLHTYTYTADDKSGVMVNAGDFEIIDNMTLAFDNYKDWGSRIVFKKFKDNPMVGTYWRWGTSLMDFSSSSTMVYRSTQYDYVYSDVSKKGVITTLGEFSIDEENGILTVIDYKGYGAKYTSLGRKVAIEFNRQDDDTTPDIDTTMLGTEWVEGPIAQWIMFINDDIIYQGSSSAIFLDPYNYNPGQRNGWIYFLNDFVINDNGSVLTCLSFKTYNHTAAFKRAKG
jgi:hypothetical protein